MSESSAVERSDRRRAEVEEVLEREIRPLLASHLGGANLTGIKEDGTVELEFTGACTSCAFRANTIMGGIYPRLRVVDGVEGVTSPGVPVTIEQQRRVAALFDKHEARRKEKAEESAAAGHECQSAC